MFSRASTLVLLSLALSSFVAATPCPPDSPGVPTVPPTGPPPTAPPYPVVPPGGPAVPPGGPAVPPGGPAVPPGGSSNPPEGGGGGGGQCNTGNLQCCNSLQKADDPSIAPLLGTLGINTGSITGLVGINCTPINILGIGGNHCTQQPVCCTGNTFSGLVNVGCTPINVGI